MPAAEGHRQVFRRRTEIQKEKEEINAKTRPDEEYRQPVSVGVGSTRCRIQRRTQLTPDAGDMPTLHERESIAGAVRAAE